MYSGKYGKHTMRKMLSVNFLAFLQSILMMPRADIFFIFFIAVQRPYVCVCVCVCVCVFERYFTFLQA